MIAATPAAAAEINRLQGLIAAVFDLHHPEWFAWEGGAQTYDCTYDGETWPCRTAVAAGVVT